MPDDPSTDPFDAPAESAADPAADPGRPDPPPDAPSHWLLPGDAAVLNPLAPEGNQGALPEFPAPAPAPGAPADAVGFDAAPPAPPSLPMYVPAADDGPRAADRSAYGSTAEGLTAAVPSSPSLPWDRHQDPLPAAPRPATSAERIVEAASANLLYLAAGGVIAFLALTALIVNVRVRSSDPQADAGDKAASAASVDRASDGGSEVGSGADAAGVVTATGGAGAGGGGTGGEEGTEGTNGTKETKGTNGTQGTDGNLSMASAAAGDAGVGAAFAVPEGYRRYDDPQHGFSLRVPADWRLAHRSSGPGDSADSPDYDVVFEAAQGEQRLAVSVWSAGERPPFEAWLLATVAGMRPLDDGGAAGSVDGGGVPYNGVLAGEPSLVLGAAETPVSHLSYAAYLQHADRYLRIAWADLTGLTRPDDVLGALATFAWAGDDIVTGSAVQANQVPRLRLPQGVYWPSEVLFGGSDSP